MAGGDFEPNPMSDTFAGRLLDRLDDGDDAQIRGWLIAAGRPFTREASNAGSSVPHE